MIKAIGNIMGHIRTTQNIKGKINNPTVKEYPELEDLEITPKVEEQVKNGLFGKITVQGDENLVPENIAQNKTIFGVEGTAKTVSAKITDCSNLFRDGDRIDYLYELLSLCENVTSTTYMFYGCSLLEKLDLSNFNTSNVTNMKYMFYNCTSLTELDLRNFDTSNVTDMQNMLYSLYACISLDLSSFDMSKVINISSMFRYSSFLEILHSFKNLGKGYTQKTNDYSNYKLDLSSCTKLTHDSLMDVIINGLYDLNLSYNVANGGTLYTQSIKIGSTNLAKLQATEEGLQAIAIANQKGWNVS